MPKLKRIPKKYKLTGGAELERKPGKLKVDPKLIKFLEQKLSADSAKVQNISPPEMKHIKVIPPEDLIPEAPPFGIPDAPPLITSHVPNSFHSSGPIKLEYNPVNRIKDLKNMKEELETAKLLCKLVKIKSKRKQIDILKDMEMGIEKKEKIKELLELNEEINILQDICEKLKRGYKKKN